MRPILAIVVLLGSLAVSTGGWAQNPSSQQIIDALRPANPLGGATRGIRPVSPGGATTIAPTPPPPSVNLTVNFRTGSAELTPQAMEALDQLGLALSSSDLAGYRFRVEGHTDTVGSAELNMLLSQRRAAAVVGYLTSRFGIASARLEAVGLGESKPLVPTGDGVDEPRNRRVQVVNIGS